MAARKKQSLINLLPAEEFATSVAGRIIAWALSTFRYIVIATELVVILAFISRFWLDAQNANLREEITQKQSLIAASASFEKEFNEVQKRLLIYKTLSSNLTLSSENFSKISSTIPEDVFLSTINLSQSNLRITGLSPNEKSISQFAVNLKKNAGYPKVVLVSVKTAQEDESLLEFELDVSLDKEQI